jgi:hypothetical protein
MKRNLDYFVSLECKVEWNISEYDVMMGFFGDGDEPYGSIEKAVLLKFRRIFHGRQSMSKLIS